MPQKGAMKRNTSMIKLTLYLLGTIAVVAAALPAYNAPLQIPTGRAIQVDGIISPGEWDDAGSVNIQVEPEWEVTALYKHDPEHLNLAFRNTRHGTVRLYPEVMIESQNLKSDAWRPGQ